MVYLNIRRYAMDEKNVSSQNGDVNTCPYSSPS